MAESKKDVTDLQAEIERLRLENQSLKQRFAPSLRTRVSIKTLFSHVQQYMGQFVGVGGWIRTVRTGAAGKLAFLKLFDGTTAIELQIVAEHTIGGFEDVLKGSWGSAVFITGQIVPSPGKEQALEMQAAHIDVLGPCDASFPLAGKGLGLEYLREKGHLRIRTALLSSVMRVRNTLAFGTHEYFQGRDFQYVNTPLITASDCEGGGEMFAVTTLFEEGKLKHVTQAGTPDFTQDFFKRPSYLTVSGQLNGETYAMGLSNIYTFGPTFRAENSHTTRHLAEFWMIEPEVAFADLTENMDLAEGYVKFVIARALTKNDADLRLLEEYEQKALADKVKEAAATEAANAAAEAKAKKDAKKAKKDDKAKSDEQKQDQPKQEKPKSEKQDQPKQEKQEQPKQEKQEQKPKQEKQEQKPKQEKQEKQPKQEQKPKDQQENQPPQSENKTAEASSDQQQQQQQQQQQRPPKQKISQKEQHKQQQQQQQKEVESKQPAPVKEWRSLPLRERLRSVVDSQFARVTYTEAIKILEQAIAKGQVFENPVSWGIDMASEHERYLCEVHFRKPTIVTNYPKEIKAFYMRLSDDKKTVAAMDVLVPGIGELIGGSQREERLDILEERMREMHLDPEAYSWYLDLRRYGSVPHAGFGLGFERLVCYTTGMDNIRDVIPFPRYPGHADF